MREAQERSTATGKGAAGFFVMIAGFLRRMIPINIVAAAALLGRRWRDAEGSRNDAALALAGGLLSAEWSEHDTRAFLRAVCAAADDEEWWARLKSPGLTARKRDAGFTAINRALKAAGVPVAGTDRLALLSDIAVQDLVGG